MDCIKLILFTSFITLTFFYCTSPQELIDKGKYERVLSKYQLKAKRSTLTIQEENHYKSAFNEWKKDKYDLLENYEKSTVYKDWEKALRQLNQIQTYQQEIRQGTSFTDDELNPIHTNQWKWQFMDKLFETHYNNYHEWVAQYHETQDRQHVIRAYGQVEKMEDYRSDEGFYNYYRDSCVALGQRNFIISFENNTFGTMFDFNTRFANQIHFSSGIWNKYHTSLPDSLIDYYVTVSLTNLRESDQEENNYINYSKEIISHYDMQTDTSGIVHNVPVYKTVEAQVKEINYTFTVLGEASIDWYDNRRKRGDGYRIFNAGAEAIETRRLYDSGDRQAIDGTVILDGSAIFFYDYSNLKRDVIQQLANQINSNL